MKRKIIPNNRDVVMTAIAFRVPENICECIDRIARRQMHTRSDVVRELIVETLRARGLVASEDEIDALVAA